MPSFMKGENAMIETVMAFVAGIVDVFNKLLLAAFTCLLIAVGVSAYDLSNYSGLPSADKCAGYQEASLPQKIGLKAFVFSRRWTVTNVGFTRVATSGEGADKVTLVQLPFTGGTWYRDGDTN